MKKIKDIVKNIGECFKGTNIYTAGVGAYYEFQKVDITCDAQSVYDTYSNDLDGYVEEQLSENLGFNADRLIRLHGTIKENYVKSLNELSEFDSSFDSDYAKYIEDNSYIDKLNTMDEADRKIELAGMKDKVRNTIITNVDRAKEEYDVSLDRMINYESMRDFIKETAEARLNEIRNNIEKNNELDDKINKIKSYEKKSVFDATKMVTSKAFSSVSNKCNIIKESTLAIASKTKQFSKNKMSFIFGNKIEKIEETKLENTEAKDAVKEDNIDMSLLYMVGDTYANLLEENRILKEDLSKERENNKKYRDMINQMSGESLKNKEITSEKLNEKDSLEEKADVVHEEHENTHPEEFVNNDVDTNTLNDDSNKLDEFESLKNDVRNLTQMVNKLTDALNNNIKANVAAMSEAKESTCKFGVKSKLFDDVSVESNNSMNLEDVYDNENIKDKFIQTENIRDEFSQIKDAKEEFVSEDVANNLDNDSDLEIYSLNDIDIKDGDIDCDFMGL